MATKPGSRHWAVVRQEVPRELAGLLIGGLTALFLGVYIHEFTHQFIFAQYGCPSSIQWLPTLVQRIAETQPDPTCIRSLSPAQGRNLRSAQLMVEAIGYQTIPLYGFLGAIGGMLLARSTGR